MPNCHEQGFGLLLTHFHHRNRKGIQGVVLLIWLACDDVKIGPLWETEHMEDDWLVDWLVDWLRWAVDELECFLWEL